MVTTCCPAPSAVTGSPSTTGAQFSSSVGGNGGSFNSSATAGNLSQLIFTSAFGNLNGVTEETAAFSLSSLNPKFATGAVTGNQAFPGGPFAAAGSGTFSSDSPVIVPEPATFVLIGGGLLGHGLLLIIIRIIRAIPIPIPGSLYGLQAL